MKTQKPVESDEWKNKYLRALADYQNLKKWSEAEKENVRKYAEEQFINKLLPVVDNLERCEHHVKNDGLTLALKELHTLLAIHGVTKFDATGQEFDPHTMECIEVVEGKKNIVQALLAPGYRMHDKVIRVAKVQVGKGQKEDVCLK